MLAKPPPQELNWELKARARWRGAGTRSNPLRLGQRYLSRLTQQLATSVILLVLLPPLNAVWPRGRCSDSFVAGDPESEIRPDLSLSLSLRCYTGSAPSRGLWKSSLAAVGIVFPSRRRLCGRSAVSSRAAPASHAK